MALNHVGSIKNQTNSIYTLFPNPSSGKVSLQRIDHGSIDKSNIRVLDLNSKVVMKLDNTDENSYIDINLSGLRSGVYTLIVENSRFVDYLKLVITK